MTVDGLPHLGCFWDRGEVLWAARCSWTAATCRSLGSLECGDLSPLRPAGRSQPAITCSSRPRHRNGATAARTERRAPLGTAYRDCVSRIFAGRARRRIGVPRGNGLVTLGGVVTRDFESFGGRVSGIEGNRQASRRTPPALFRNGERGSWRRARGNPGGKGQERETPRGNALGVSR
jgi:hypothetical protein